MRDTLLPSKASKRANSWLGKSARLLFHLMEQTGSLVWYLGWINQSKHLFPPVHGWGEPGTKALPGCPGLGAGSVKKPGCSWCPSRTNPAFNQDFLCYFQGRNPSQGFESHVQFSVFLIKVCSFYVLFPVFIFSQMMDPFIIRGDNFD